MKSTSTSVPRRGILLGGTAAALSGILAGARPAAASVPLAKASPASAKLKFGANGKFKIVQFNDTQDGPRTDRRTLELMEAVLDAEKPGFVVINGDVIDGSPNSPLEVKQAINNVVQPMESRKIPWALTFGNHDEDSTSHGTKMTEAKILDFVRRYDYNLNTKEDDVYGSSNSQLLIASARSNKPAFGIWLLDSGRYAPDSVGGQDFEGLMSYDWIRPEQIDWYREASGATERRHGKVDSLMFFHIPLWEHHHMWFGSQFTSNEADHAKAVKKHGIVGVKNEEVYVGAFNSGLFAALQERGDVRGAYCGHDHINTYMGNYFGIELGYGPGTGFGPYGVGGAQEHSLRGARVFELDEHAKNVYTGTRTIFAKDLGINMDPARKPLDQPLPLPQD
ncbi:metallophosphoesterase family protein [Paeniglutamicibacter terrestris]|uniref:Phosphoesterase n=1 Tax=Paeniglutamicibacter terrestris TaxID=2723403 RepID=A0ABX1FZS7_9MICC|nr:metallophosphoesterase family protein [Paeniglutamicibacter terrestris]NKG19462.1 phosphoesterase [Paeniglutamicibacter terrestris]